MTRGRSSRCGIGDSKSGWSSRQTSETDAAGLTAMGQVEVLVAPLLETGVIDRRGVAGANILPGPVEVDRGSLTVNRQPGPSLQTEISPWWAPE